MQYRRLGNAGMKVSTVSLGGWINYGEGKVAEDTAAIQETLVALLNGANINQLS